MARHVGTKELVKDGSVYVLHNPSLGSDVYKIGMTTVDVTRRAKDVGRQFKFLDGLKAVFAQPTRDAYQWASLP